MGDGGKEIVAALVAETRREVVVVDEICDEPARRAQTHPGARACPGVVATISADPRGEY
jgi:hypothetical protein